MHKLDEMEEKSEEKHEWQTLKGDDLQMQKLNALAFEDSWGPNVRVFNVCKAKKGPHTTCGLYFPGRMWFQPDKKRHKLCCHVDWSQLGQRPDRCCYIYIYDFTVAILAQAP